MNSPQVTPQQPADAPDLKTILTWRGAGVDRLEQVRVQTVGSRIKAYGQIISAATADQEAFCATYDLLTTDAGVTRRLAVHLVRASGETQISITRDAEGTWLVQTPQGTERGDFGGAKDVDVAMSPMFNSLPIRRLALDSTSLTFDVPVVYLYLPDVRVTAASVHYDSSGDTIAVESPVATSTITTDPAGFVRDYAGLAERV